MSVEATYCKYKQTNFKIAIIAMVVLGAWFAYDGYVNDKFQEEHTTAEGKPDSTLVFNRRAPFFLGAGALIAAGWFAAVKGRKVIAEEDEIVICCCKKIPYGSIESVDKTNYEVKGFFMISYKDSAEQLKTCKLSDRNFDNLSPVLERIVEKIS